jgi:hypothetical protein
MVVFINYIVADANNPSRTLLCADANRTYHYRGVRKRHAVMACIYTDQAPPALLVAFVLWHSSDRFDGGFDCE